MLQVQRYLRLHGLEALGHAYGIDVVRHPEYPLLMLNYGLRMPHALKTSDIVRECRSLVLEDETWEVVGRSFLRFFNLGEPTQLPFNWSSFSTYSKEDGSLMLLFNYGGKWIVTTRRSFANGRPNGLDRTWQTLFSDLLPAERFEKLSSQATYVFEYCSPWTQVVHYHKTPQLFLLAAFNNADGSELADDTLGYLAEQLNVQRPLQFLFNSLDDLHRHMDTVSDLVPTFEGFVVKDQDGNRLKIKSESYLRLHKLFNNNQVHSKEAVLELILSEEIDEALAYRPSLLPVYFQVIRSMYGVVGLLDAVWSHAKVITEQKAFAQFVIEHLGRDLAGVLFTARKMGCEPRECLSEFQCRLLKFV